MVAGVLLQTTRNYVTHTCTQRFDKFATICTEQQVVYDEDTGLAVTLDRSSGGLSPYGVDAVFLADSSAYDDTVAVGEFFRLSRCLSSVSCFKSAHVKLVCLPCGCIQMVWMHTAQKASAFGLCFSVTIALSHSPHIQQSGKVCHQMDAPPVHKLTHSK